MAAENLPGADQARRAKWTVSGRAPLQIPADPWKSDTVEKLRAEVVSEAAKKDIDLTSNPRALLGEPDLCKMLWPGVAKFFQADAEMVQDIRKFVSELIAKGSEWLFKDALQFVKKHGVMETTDLHMQPVMKFLGECVCMDPINIEQAINVLFAFLTNNDHRILCGSMQLRDDMPTIFIAGSGGGKSPMIIKTVLQKIVMKVEAIVKRIPGGLSSFITAGTNYSGWLTAIVRLMYRACFLWEELFYGINKGTGNSKTDKMTLEENIRCFNPMAVGGDLRATVDRQLQADTKCSVMAGLQYNSFHEYLAGDTKGALERYHFCLSDVLTPKNTPQEHRLADQTQSTKQLIAMFEHHVEHMFPAEVMAKYEASLSQEHSQAEGAEVEPHEQEDEAGAAASPAPRPERPSGCPAAGQPAPKKRQKNEIAPKKKHVLMPPSGINTSLDADSEEFFTRACNYYRQAVPDEYANHAFFASAMKVDQTFARFVATRTRRREAFMKTIFGETWQMANESHPVDMPMAEASLRCDLAMRFAVYNELQHKLAKAAGQSSGGKYAGQDGEADGEIPSGPKRLSEKQGEFEKVLRKMVQFAERNAEGKIEFDPNAFRHRAAYKGSDGWCKFLAQAHGHQLIEKIYSEGKGMVPAVDAILDGEVGTMRVRGGKTSGPSFILDTAKVAAWFLDEGVTQPGDGIAADADGAGS